MKTSILLIAAIFLNTTLILSEPFSLFKEHINTWVLLIIEVVLVGGFYIHKTVKELQKACEIDFDGSKVFVVKDNNKTKSPSK